MINLQSYIEYWMDIKGIVNKTCPYHIEGVCAAISEAHMVKKLVSTRGITLCVSYPDAKGTGTMDSLSEVQQGYIFIVDKVAPGTDTHEEEIARYTKLQTVALAIRDAMLNSACDCFDLLPENDYKIEWEWQIFGGYNGISIGFKFTNND